MEVRQRIVMGAVDLMNANGVKNTTMDDVASSLGISKRTIYENFADKKALILASAQYLIAEQEVYHKRILTQSGDVIEEIASLLNFMHNSSQHQGRIAYDVKRLYPDMYNRLYVEHYRRSYEHISDQLSRGIEQGFIIKSTNVTFTAYVIIESIQSMMTNPEKLFSMTNVSPIEAFRYMIVYFFRGIATSQGIQKIDALIKLRNL